MKNTLLLGLTSKKKLAFFLGCSTKDLYDLSSDRYYHLFPIKNGDKSRNCEVPTGKLKLIHGLVHKELRKEQLPSWFFSCKGRGYVANANWHARPNIYLVKMDLSRFYPSCKINYIFKLFRDKEGYALPGDIAGLLAKILTYKGHIPTRSSVSGLLAFWSYHHCFNEIYKYSAAHNFKMSLYVDDITLSGLKPPSKVFIHTIENIIKKYKLSPNNEKLKLYVPFRSKLVTGVIIGPSGNKNIPNKLRKKIIDEQSKNLLEINSQRLAGLNNAAYQVTGSKF